MKALRIQGAKVAGKYYFSNGGGKCTRQGLEA